MSIVAFKKYYFCVILVFLDMQMKIMYPSVIQIYYSAWVVAYEVSNILFLLDMFNARNVQEGIKTNNG